MQTKELITLVKNYPKDYKTAREATRSILLKSMLNSSIQPSIDQHRADKIAEEFSEKTDGYREHAHIIVNTALSDGEINAESADLMNHIVDYYFSVSHAERTRLAEDEIHVVSDMLCEVAESGSCSSGGDDSFPMDPRS